MADQDFKAAQDSYGSFVGMIKGGSIAMALAGLVVLLLIS